MIDLSALFPFYDIENIPAVVDSFRSSAKDLSYEIIFIGPKEIPKDLLQKNCSFIKSYSSPLKSEQLASIRARGEYIVPLCTDGYYYDHAIDDSFKVLNSHNRAFKTIISGRYKEAPGRIFNKKALRVFSSAKYWLINNSPVTRSGFVPDNWKILNFPIVKTDYFKELGGFDCRFETQAIGHTDFAVRSQRDGAAVILSDAFMAEADHFPGVPPDRYSGHGPTFYAQTEGDEPLYKKIYSNPNCVDRIKIPYDNWNNVEDIWNRRKY